MPVYEYQCQDCGKTFEVLQAISDKPLKACENCGGAVKRLISQTSFSLKGQGWYKDGYSSPKPEANPATPATKKETQAPEKPPAKGADPSA